MSMHIPGPSVGRVILGPVRQTRRCSRVVCGHEFQRSAHTLHVPFGSSLFALSQFSSSLTTRSSFSVESEMTPLLFSPSFRSCTPLFTLSRVYRTELQDLQWLDVVPE